MTATTVSTPLATIPINYVAGATKPRISSTAAAEPRPRQEKLPAIICGLLDKSGSRSHLRGWKRNCGWGFWMPGFMQVITIAYPFGWTHLVQRLRECGSVIYGRPRLHFVRYPLVSVRFLLGSTSLHAIPVFHVVPFYVLCYEGSLRSQIFFVHLATGNNERLHS